MTGRTRWLPVFLRLLGSLIVLALGLLLAFLIVWPMAMKGQGMLSPGGALLMLDVMGTVLALVYLWRQGRPVRLWPLLPVGALVLFGLLQLMGAF